MSDVDLERLKKIEDRLSLLEQRMDLSYNYQLYEAEEQATPSSYSEPKTYSPFVSWFMQNWISCIGVFLVILALGWFVKYAFANSWINESTVVYLGLAAGAAIYSFGAWHWREHPKNASILLMLGLVVSSAALIVGDLVYHVFSSAFTSISVFFLLGLTVALSIIKNLEGLGVFSCFFAFVVPTYLLGELSNYNLLPIYYLAVAFGTLCMLMQRKWLKPFIIAWLFISTVVPYPVEEALSWQSNLFNCVCYLIFFFPFAVSAIRSNPLTKPIKGIFVLVTLPMPYMIWMFFFIEFPLNVIYLFFSAFIWGFFGYAFAKSTGSYSLSSGRLGSCVGLVSLFFTMSFIFFATYAITVHLLPFAVAQNVNTLCYFVEIATAIVLTHFLLPSSKASSALSLFYILPLCSLLYDESAFLHAPMLSLKFATLVAANIALFLAAYISLKSHAKSKSRFEFFSLPNVLWAVASALAMALLWNICHQIFSNANLARASALVIYIIVAEILIFLSHQRQIKPLQFAGIALILFVIFDLLTIEISKMPALMRILSFSIVGLLLLVTTFLNNKSKQLIA